jgi:hypothetical protein
MLKAFRFSLSVMFACAAGAAVTAPSLAEAQTGKIKTQQAGNRCMVVKDGSTAAGAPMILWDCNGTGNELFTASPVGEFRLYGGALCLGISGSGNAGDALVTAQCNGSAAQRWVWDNGVVRGINGRCIDAAGGGTGNGTRVLLWDCQGAMNQKWMTSSDVIAANARRKLYAFDGTNSYEIHHNSLFHVYERWNGPKYWRNGPNLLAMDINTIYNDGVAAICADVRAFRVNEVFLMGYSRGAMVALKLAYYKAGCDANIKFIGLVDAVNTSLIQAYWPTVVNPGPLAVHLKKRANPENVLTTATITGALTTYDNYYASATHKQMTCFERDPLSTLAVYDDAWRWTRDQLVNFAQKAGGSFSAQVRQSTDC